MHVLECLSDCTTFVIAQFTTFCLRIMTFQLPLFWITLYLVMVIHSDRCAITEHYCVAELQVYASGACRTRYY